jgi:hypothetical protein
MNAPTNEIPMSAGVHMEDASCIMADMSHPSAMTALFAAEVFRFDQMFSHRRTLQIIEKAKK